MRSNSSLFPKYLSVHARRTKRISRLSRGRGLMRSTSMAEAFRKSELTTLSNGIAIRVRRKFHSALWKPSLTEKHKAPCPVSKQTFQSTVHKNRTEKRVCVL